jgi:hypothetical protein
MQSHRISSRKAPQWHHEAPWSGIGCTLALLPHMRERAAHEGVENTDAARPHLPLPTCSPAARAARGASEGTVASAEPQRPAQASSPVHKKAGGACRSLLELAGARSLRPYDPHNNPQTAGRRNNATPGVRALLTPALPHHLSCSGLLGFEQLWREGRLRVPVSLVCPGCSARPFSEEAIPLDMGAGAPAAGRGVWTRSSSPRRAATSLRAWKTRGAPQACVRCGSSSAVRGRGSSLGESFEARVSRGKLQALAEAGTGEHSPKGRKLRHNAHELQRTLSAILASAQQRRQGAPQNSQSGRPLSPAH